MTFSPLDERSARFVRLIKTDSRSTELANDERMRHARYTRVYGHGATH